MRSILVGEGVEISGGSRESTIVEVTDVLRLLELQFVPDFERLLNPLLVHISALYEHKTVILQHQGDLSTELLGFKMISAHLMVEASEVREPSHGEHVRILRWVVIIYCSNC